jgi:hypothetical protein
VDISCSRTFFEFTGETSDLQISDFHSSKGRLCCLAALFEVIGLLPFSLLYKLYRTFLRTLGLISSSVLLFLTLGISEGARAWFIRRVSRLAMDVADWVLFPFAILSCVAKLLFSLIYPVLYFRY